MKKITVMINSALSALIKYTQKGNKKTINAREITFCIFKILNAQVSKKIFLY
jgi:folate-dependent tRNA-U54 methylase TrmFO/GidA